MNLSQASVCSTWSARWNRSRLILALILALPFAGLTGCFRIGSDAQALRDSVLKSAAVKWDERVEIGVGSISLTLARFGLSFVELDSDARTALKAVRGAEVGVYDLKKGVKKTGFGALLSEADQVMSKRGWDRIVGVVQDDQMVTVYVQKDIGSSKNAKACVAVLNRRELVIASARSDLESLLELAFSKADLKSRLSAGL